MMEFLILILLKEITKFHIMVVHRYIQINFLLWKTLMELIQINVSQYKFLKELHNLKCFNKNSNLFIIIKILNKNKYVK